MHIDKSLITILELEKEVYGKKKEYKVIRYNGIFLGMGTSVFQTEEQKLEYVKQRIEFFRDQYIREIQKLKSYIVSYERRLSKLPEP